MTHQIKLGDKTSSEELLRDLFINLRSNTWKWASITKQTPQARMGYIGQHLVSVVTGFEGGRTGARGADIIIPKGDNTAEIKTCYRVDQLGTCRDCNQKVSSWEETCPNTKCNSRNIVRKDDSKWLFSPKSKEEVEALLSEKWIYCVLFEFVDINDGDSPIVVSIFQIDPRGKGFSNMIIDYYFNNREAKEKNGKKASPFNFWPRSPKFFLCEPRLIYEAIIESNDDIKTTLFPSDENDGNIVEVPALNSWGSKKIIDKEGLEKLNSDQSIECNCKPTKTQCLVCIEKWRQDSEISNKDLVEMLVHYAYKERNKKYEMYLPE